MLGSNALTFGRRLSFSNYYLPGLSPRKSEIGVSMSAVMATLGSTQPPSLLSGSGERLGFLLPTEIVWAPVLCTRRLQPARLSADAPQSGV